MRPCLSQNPALAQLAENLRARASLGLGLVQGDAAQLERLLSRLQGKPQAQDLADPTEQVQAPSLAAIQAGLGDCRRCALANNRRRLVFGQGPPGARLMVIGEAPGQQEDAQGLPFVGPAGQLLDRMLAAVGIKRAQAYITNIVKCHPPKNQDPRPEEVAACRPFLLAQVQALRPALILALGRPAAQALTGSDAPISALRGHLSSLEGVPLLPTFHPAFLLRSPQHKAEVYRDLKEMARLLGQAPERG